MTYYGGYYDAQGWPQPPIVNNDYYNNNYNNPLNNMPIYNSNYYNVYQPNGYYNYNSFNNNNNNNVYGHQSANSLTSPLPSTSSQTSSYAHYEDYAIISANSNRLSRNRAEKLRRDKLNTYISELASLVPMVSNSPKRMDKTSVLRLSATFLRMNQLITGTKEQQEKLPQFLNSVNWSQLLLDDVDGVMLIVTSAGKIIFISHHIEKLLGHTQIELFGQSLFNITCPEDHVELKKNLTPDEEEETDCGSDLGYESSPDELVQCSPCATKVAVAGTSTENPSLERQRRGFYLRLRHRCVARSEEPQYELVYVMGHLRVPAKCDHRGIKRCHKQKGAYETLVDNNEIVLVAMLKPFRERRVTEISLLEASKDEYVTRHTIDGSIIYSDHRISVVSGYLPEEVSGKSAFKFMHKDDVGWVMIALRQMFWKAESFGSSVYRLLSKNNEYIYLRTHGYLELNNDQEKIESFICINSLLSPEEGEREIRNMKVKFSPLIENRVETGTCVIADSTVTSTTDSGHNDMELYCAIKAMITNIPPVSMSTIKEDPHKAKEAQFVKVKVMSKALPPVSQQKATLNVVCEEKTCSTSPPPSTSPLSVDTMQIQKSSTSPLSIDMIQQTHKPSTSPLSIDMIQNYNQKQSTSPMSIDVVQNQKQSTSPMSIEMIQIQKPTSPMSIGMIQNSKPLISAMPIGMLQNQKSSTSMCIGMIQKQKSSTSSIPSNFIQNQNRPSVICNAPSLSSKSQISTLHAINNNKSTPIIKKEEPSIEYQVNGVIQQIMKCDSKIMHDIKEEPMMLNDVDLDQTIDEKSDLLHKLNCLGQAEERATILSKNCAKRLCESVHDTVPFKRSPLLVTDNSYKRSPPIMRDNCVGTSPIPPEFSSIARSPPFISSTTFDVDRTISSIEYVGSLEQSIKTEDLEDPLNPGMQQVDVVVTHVRCYVNNTCGDKKPIELLENASGDLKNSHIRLESRMELQGAQLNSIEDDLHKSTIPAYTSQQLCFQTDLSHLKEQHDKQKKLLVCLQHDHQSLDPHTNVLSVQQDVEV